VSLKTWCSPTELISQAITSKTKVVIAVHNYGLVDDLNVLADLCKKKNIYLIEDAAEALGAELNSRKLGSIGDIGTFSFYGNKIITSGEGGAVVTNNPELLSRMRLLRGQAMDPERRYYFAEMGYNFRLSNLSSAILCSQLRRLPKLVRKRNEIFATYSQYLKNVPGVHFPKKIPGSEQAPWLFTVLIDANRDLVASKLAALGIETRPTFFPITELPAFSLSTELTFPNTKHISENGLSLPTYAEMNHKEIRMVCKHLSDILASEQRIE
jgi:perosamine synthetase